MKQGLSPHFNTFSEESFLAGYNFMAANALPHFLWHSELLLSIRAADQYLAEQYKAKPDFTAKQRLFSACSKEDLEEINIPPDISGEYFLRVKIGRGTFIGTGCNFVAHGGIQIGRNCEIGNDVQIVTVFHGIHPDQRCLDRVAPVIIGDNVKIEQGSVIVNSSSSGKPVVIGNNAVVKRDSLVLRSVPENSIVEGSPAQSLEETNTSPDLKKVWEASVPVNDEQTLSRIDDLPSFIKAFGKEAICIPPVFVGSAENVQAEGLFFINRNSAHAYHGKARIGEGTLFAPFTSVNVPEDAQLIIGKNVWVGAKATINVPAGQTLSIGEGAIIGAGAEINTDIPKNSVVVGKGRIIKTIDDTSLFSVPDAWKNTDSLKEQHTEGYRTKLKPYLKGFETGEFDPMVFIEQFYAKEKAIIEASRAQEVCRPRTLG